jgi:hypothetical protein
VGLLLLPQVAAGRHQTVHDRDRVEHPGAGRIPRAVHQLQFGERRFAGQPQSEPAREVLVTARAGQPHDAFVGAERAYQSFGVRVHDRDGHSGGA